MYILWAKKGNRFYFLLGLTVQTPGRKEEEEEESSSRSWLDWVPIIARYWFTPLAPCQRVYKHVCASEIGTEQTDGRRRRVNKVLGSEHQGGRGSILLSLYYYYYSIVNRLSALHSAASHKSDILSILHWSTVTGGLVRHPYQREKCVCARASLPATRSLGVAGTLHARRCRQKARGGSSRAVRW